MLSVVNCSQGKLFPSFLIFHTDLILFHLENEAVGHCNLFTLNEKTFYYITLGKKHTYSIFFFCIENGNDTFILSIKTTVYTNYMLKEIYKQAQNPLNGYHA